MKTSLRGSYVVEVPVKRVIVGCPLIHKVGGPFCRSRVPKENNYEKYEGRDSVVILYPNLFVVPHIRSAYCREETQRDFLFLV